MSITNVDLNLMVVLHTVLAERNVARAADRLHVTPSAVSNSLARLRDLIGDPLVTRKGRGIVPTPRAIELAPRIAKAIGELESALLAAPFDARTCTRTFTLAVADVGQVTWVPRLAGAMMNEMPLAHLRVVGIDALVSLGDLTSAEVDVHVGIPSKDPGLHAQRLFQERSVLVARRGHRILDAKPSRRALGELRHVRVDMVPGKNFRDAFAATFAKAGIARAIVMTVPTFTTAAEVVARTDLVTMLPTSLFEAKGKSLGLRAVAAPLPAHGIELAMCWHERTHADPAARAFRDLVRRVVGESTP
ncbi:Transcriptional regulator, LysR family [Labilithrix luteola]|uniref:Transcriptional regulator, LysR family n=1 Tax=Labilithrix luteola TaxID=1391654 RepID=A0A0K1PJ67_9BACT|nr:LysR family transcriptional regulator [Labilithrix luteola]AKU93565.1 Transcriptional regulator, LysR family [Labilithrix luteola]